MRGLSPRSFTPLLARPAATTAGLVLFSMRQALAAFNI
jgi:hypothetical protein